MDSLPDTSARDDECNLNDVRRRIGYSIAGIAHTPYRQLQHLAKMCGVPCNLKKDDLKMVIRAKMNGDHGKVEQLLKQIRDARSLRRKRREKTKALETADPDQSNQKIKPEGDGEETMNQGDLEEAIIQNRIRSIKEDLLRNIRFKNRKVTIQQTSTQARFQALITPSSWHSFNKCLGITATKRSQPLQPAETSHCNPRAIKYSTVSAPAATRQGCQVTTSTAVGSAEASQWNSQFDYSKLNTRNGIPRSQLLQPARAIKYTTASASAASQGYRATTSTAAGPAEASQWNSEFENGKLNNGNCVPAALSLYHRNHVSYEPPQRMADNSSWTGSKLYHHSDMGAAAQPLPSFQNLHYKNRCRNIQPYSNNQSSDTYPRTQEVAYQANQLERVSYGGFMNGIQRASSPFTMKEKVDGQNINDAPLRNSEVYTGLYHIVHPDTIEVYSSNFQKPFDFIPERATPNVFDVTKMAMEPQNNNTDLGLLANMAVTKAQDLISVTTSHQYNNGLLMINENEGIPTSEKVELIACDAKPTQDVPTWNHILEKMSNNLSPGITNSMAAVHCKYGCHTPVTTRQQQLGHEQHCLQQPTQCPLDQCTFMGPLSSLTTHILNVHNNEVKSNTNGSYFFDLTDGKCSFGQPRSWLRDCPKKLCFPQLVDGRLFLVRVMGNFDSMQVIVYVQYVNDFYNWKSHAACELVRKDGVPYQFKGEVYPLTFNPMHIISRRNCLIFNMDSDDWTQNLFMLHTKIVNCGV